MYAKLLLFLLVSNLLIAQVLAEESAPCDTSQLEAKIDALNQKVDNLEKVIKEEQKETQNSIITTLLSLPLLFIQVIINTLLINLLGFSDASKIQTPAADAQVIFVSTYSQSDRGIFASYEALYGFKPQFSYLEKTVTEFSNMLIGAYAIIFIFCALVILYKGAIGTRAEIKESIGRTLVGIILLKSCYWVYELLIAISTALTALFKGYIDFNLLGLNLKQIIFNLDVITIFIAFSVLLGLLLGVMVYLVELVGLLLFPLVIFSLSLPFQKVRGWGEIVLNFLIAVMLAPAISAACLAIVPIALQSTSGLSSLLINRLVLLAGIIMAIAIPLLIIISLILKPIITVISITKILRLKKVEWK